MGRVLRLFPALLFLAPCCARAQDPLAALSRHNLQLPNVRNITTPNAPFSAICILDFTPAPGTAGKPVHMEEKFYRDGAGRIRTEGGAEGQSVRAHLVDPAKHGRWLWSEGDSEAVHYDRRDTVPLLPQLEALPGDAPRVGGIPTRLTHSANPQNSAEVKDVWYSPELRLPLAETLEDPAWGKASLRFTHIQRGEPDAALFVLPATLSVREYGAPSSGQAVEAASSTRTADPKATETKAWFYSDPKFMKAYDEAKALHRGHPEDFLAVWKHADKAAKGECIECQRQIIQWQMQMGAFHDTEKTAAQMLALAQKPEDKFFAESELGQAYLHENYEEPKPEQLREAEAHLRAALVLAPKAKNVLFLEGRALAMEGRDDEARQAFKRYAELTDASDRYHARAERFVETPHLAAMRMAPPFHMVTSQGEEMNLDDMHGKVVLLDFWATWCGPCKETLPEVASIAKEFRNEPLVVISISWDADANAWQQFVQKNHMDWPQYRDADSALRRVYGVTAIPHFFTIDADGVLQAEQVGSNADIHAKLKKLVKQAHAMQAQAQVADAGTQH